MSTYGLLLAAIAIEVVATTALKASHGMTRLVPSVIVVVGYVVSFYLVAILLKRMDLGLVYATWSALGTAAIAIIGVVIYDDALTIWRVTGLFLIIAGVMLLNLSGGHAS
ncbi:MAG TPA: multidrug efflux SMR transporter [Thermomicrobiales bacterium]|nr:multidrug efflux SMR transporter [Thermomicrobiales bacterium]